MIFFENLINVGIQKSGEESKLGNSYLKFRNEIVLFMLTREPIDSFWTPGLPEGVLSNRPCPLVRWSVFRPSLNILETAH